jgi:hypothetical protein
MVFDLTHQPLDGAVALGFLLGRPVGTALQCISLRLMREIAACGEGGPRRPDVGLSSVLHRNIGFLNHLGKLGASLEMLAGSAFHANEWTS